MGGPPTPSCSAAVVGGRRQQLELVSGGGGVAAKALLAPAELVSEFGGGVWYRYRRLFGSVVVRLSAVCGGRRGDLMLNGLFFS
jgi:hypothetical protein